MAVNYQKRTVGVTPEDLQGWAAADGPQSHQLSVSGPCPICHFEYRDLVRTDVNVVDGFNDDAVPNVDNLPKLCDCACAEDHPNRPEKILTGCGASWVIAVIKRADGQYEVEPGDLRYLAALRAFNEAVENELENVRKSAGNWVAGVAALLGLFSLAGLVFAKDAIENLAPGYQEAFAGLAAFALATAAAATYLAYRAAYGWPRHHNVENVTQLQRFFGDYQERASKSAGALKGGVIFTFASIAALLVALIVLWFGPPAIPPQPHVKVTSSDGRAPMPAALRGNG